MFLLTVFCQTQHFARSEANNHTLHLVSMVTLQPRTSTAVPLPPPPPTQMEHWFESLLDSRDQQQFMERFYTPDAGDFASLWHLGVALSSLWHNSI